MYLYAIIFGYIIVFVDSDISVVFMYVCTAAIDLISIGITELNVRKSSISSYKVSGSKLNLGHAPIRHL